MLPEFLIAMPSRRDVEIPLHLVPFQTPKDATAIRTLTPSQSRRPPKLPLRTPHLPQNMSYVRVLLLFLHHLPALQSVHPFIGIDPMVPDRPVLLQHVASQDAIPAGVLNVYVEIGTLHRDDNVEIDLQIVGDALFDGEEVGYVAGVPAAKFREGEDGGDDDESNSHVATPGGATGVGCFGFGCE